MTSLTEEMFSSIYTETVFDAEFHKNNQDNENIIIGEIISSKNSKRIKKQKIKQKSCFYYYVLCTPGAEGIIIPFLPEKKYTIGEFIFFDFYKAETTSSAELAKKMHDLRVRDVAVMMKNWRVEYLVNDLVYIKPMIIDPESRI